MPSTAADTDPTPSNGSHGKPPAGDAATETSGRRRRALRWAAPVAAAALAVGGGLMANTAAADPTLPHKTPQQLLTAVASAKVAGLSGTVRESAELGLPSLPTGEGPHAGADFKDLLSGTHTLKVWTSGQDKARVALLGSYGESDLIRNGNQAWLWSSKDKSAVHLRYAGKAADHRRPTEVPATPQEAARQILDAVQPTTRVSVARNVTVAGRSAYQLVLSPKDTRSLVDQVTIAVDAKTSVPLQVQVLADGQSAPAFSVGFTSVDFTVPSADRFTFNPPAGTKVTEHKVPGGELSGKNKAQARERAKAAAEATTVVGKGWTTVVVGELPQQASDTKDPQLKQLLRALPRVSGSWGSGRLLRGTLFSAVLTDDGRVAVGAVRPALLYKALDK
jgi:outer membrane lipoprotein-sorting protein